MFGARHVRSLHAEGRPATRSDIGSLKKEKKWYSRSEEPGKWMIERGSSRGGRVVITCPDGPRSHFGPAGRAVHFFFKET